MVTIIQGEEERGLQVELIEGETIAKAIQRSGIHFSLPCGGNAKCGKCRIAVLKGKSPLSPLEIELLSNEDIERGVRLACQAPVEKGMIIRIPDTRGDISIVSSYESGKIGDSPLFSKMGLAIDIGTTTVAAQLFDKSGDCLGIELILNPQDVYGADVISRIEYALSGGTQDLYHSINDEINRLATSLCEQASIQLKQIDRIVIAGNTTMLYLLTGNSPQSLARFPFEADDLFGRYDDKLKIVPELSSDAQIYLPACMSAFVGADITLAVWISEICKLSQPAMLVDIGTNGEIALWTGKKLIVAATAAGPAFEGVGISCGIFAKAGAIDTVSWDGHALRCTVIGQVEPVGLCGSGVIDSVAAALDAGLIDESGRINHERGSHLFPGRKGDIASIPLSQNISLHQKDIRMIQLAKSAIRSGIELLLKEAQLSPFDVEKVYLAGGFGQKMNPKSAIRIGLLPSEYLSKIVFLGNASLAGCVGILFNEKGIAETELIAKHSLKENLATNPNFMELFTDHMFFHADELA